MQIVLSTGNYFNSLLVKVIAFQENVIFRNKTLLYTIYFHRSHFQRKTIFSDVQMSHTDTWKPDDFHRKQLKLTGNSDRTNLVVTPTDEKQEHNPRYHNRTILHQ